MDDFLDEQVRHAGTAAFGELEWRSQVDNISGIPIVSIVVVLMSIAARYLKKAEALSVEAFFMGLLSAEV